MNFVAYVDGYCPGNGAIHARIGGSYVVYRTSDISITLDHRKLKNETPILENLRFPITAGSGVRPTNNVAEASSMSALLSELYTKGILVPGNRVIVYNDSDLIRKQILGVYSVKNNNLRKIYNGVATLFSRFEKKYMTPVWDVLELRHISGAAMKAHTAIAH